MVTHGKKNCYINNFQFYLCDMYLRTRYKCGYILFEIWMFSCVCIKHRALHFLFYFCEGKKPISLIFCLFLRLSYYIKFTKYFPEPKYYNLLVCWAVTLHNVCNTHTLQIENVLKCRSICILVEVSHIWIQLDSNVIDIWYCLLYCIMNNQFRKKKEINSFWQTVFRHYIRTSGKIMVKLNENMYQRKKNKTKANTE